MTTETNSPIDGIKRAFAPLNEAFENLQKMEVPAGARDFVKRAAGTAQERATDLHNGSEKVTAAIESAVTGSVGEVAKISRAIQQAIYDDAKSFFVGIDKLASATSLNEAVQIQSDYARASGELFVSRAKASAEYVGNLVSNGAKTVQENLSKVASYGKSA
jgi:phasin